MHYGSRTGSKRDAIPTADYTSDSEKPVLYVFSKIDALADGQLGALQARIGNLIPNSVFASAVADGGLELLRRSLLSAVRERTRVAEVRFSSSDGKPLARVHREADVLEQKTEDGQLVLTARLANKLAERLRRAGATVG